MKKKLIAISVITVMSITPAFANYIESPRGISQSEWHASSTYQNFQCPTGTSRGEGVDMNFTTTRSDDFYFVTCSPIIIIPTPTPTPTPVISETSTVTVIPIITENTNISSSSTSSETTTITPTPVVTETSTSTSTTPTNSTTSTTLTNSQLLTLIMNLINQLMALIAQMK